MKKMLKLAAVLVALFAMTNFIACSDGGGSSSSGGGTDDTSNGSTASLNGHVGKYYTLKYGYFSDAKLKSCIYFETNKTGTLWYYDDNYINLNKKSFTYTAAIDEYGIKRLDITWEGKSSSVEATFDSDDSHFIILMFFDDGDVSDYNVDTKPDVLN